MSVQTLAFPIARRFVAGETSAEAIEVVAERNAAGMAATIDLLGEDVRTAADADRMRDGYLALIDDIARANVDTNLSLKLSGLGQRFDAPGTLARFGAILGAAQNSLPDPFVRTDMENSPLTTATLDIVTASFASHGNVGPALQAALRRTPADVARMIRLGIRVRLCKGAYRESPAISLQSAHDIRVQYLALATQLLQHGMYPAIATHDPVLIAAVQEVVRTHNIDRTTFEFQLLYGCRPDLQSALVRDGYRVRVYVPFGTHWAKYFRRRITERRANALFALRALVAK